MDKTTIGDRIKQYEFAYNHIFPIKVPLICRLDGKNFHSQVKRWKCQKPFDEHLIDAMLFTAKSLCEEISGSQIAYIQSDEITILIRDDMTINSQPWFGKEINKILSVSASKASNAFNWYFHNHKPYTINLLAEFDCRGFVVPEYEIINTFLFRQQDAARNSVQMIGRSHFSHKELHNKSNSEIQEMLFQKHNINWNDVPIHHKRGACVYKKDVQKDVPARDEKGKIIEGKFESTVRGTWIIDKEIPIFSQDKNFINKYTKV